MLRKSPSERLMSQARLQYSSGKGFIPSTLGLLDSGHATMSSSNKTFSHHHSGDPLRATGRSTPCIDKQRRAGSLQDFVPPLCAIRLGPSQHETRWEVLCITEEGKVCFKSRSHDNLLSSSEAGRMDQQITEIMQVSSNGMDIEIYRPLSTSQSDGDSPFPHQTPSPEHPGFYLHASLKYHDLPNYHGLLKQYWKKYQHLSVYVGMVRAKTVKVTLYTPQAKCLMMENGPDADFEVLFNNGAKIHQTSSSTRFIEEGGRTYLVEKREEVPEAMKALHEHTQEGLRKCKSIEQFFEELETQGSGENYFPVIIGRRCPLPPPTTNPQDASSQGNCDSSKGHSSDRLMFSDLCTSSPSTTQFPDYVTQMPSDQGTLAKSLVPEAVSSRKSLSGGWEEHYKNLPSRHLVQSKAVRTRLEFRDGSQLELQFSRQCCLQVHRPTGTGAKFWED